ncbi:glycosyltransferase family 2 protein [Eubacterium sp. OM08-24]|jgi:glycosyltransferase involved in cell wall biosynthesis|uniref:glycosyltransferase family 2 protein n=1 Tax=Eubacterium sp. OM08-24 TaxID=2292352 RepID=UPI000E43D7DE|nr:glycosyltransferase family 2 protein [Eubacterium sp. OM08-24]RGM21729.1 glycosyltransferase family 2 protein [Eubacterium sp. OM08-24]
MLISVIVPVYKVEEYIYRCVDSILAQSFKDFELILVDDGSPDNCGKICDEYAQKDKRITVIHKENGGLSDARNTGIDWALKNSNSNWITFIDSDDWVHTDYLKNLYNAVKENNVDISVCGYVNTTGEDDLHTKNSEINTLLCTPEDFFINNNINAVVAWGKLYKKVYGMT